jgi:hypothetical protein
MPREQKTTTEKPTASSKTAPIVYATEAFIAVVHQEKVSEADAVNPGSFELEFDSRGCKDLSTWTVSFLPHLNTTLLMPPEGQTVLDAAAATAKKA